ncbi:MAG: PorP/SprF family type IX secretion system membrane protein [Cytophagales bacterium]|nr:PorP/SprF family type IX secretion system membrane protein [Cytophagales bacterium]
MQHHIYTSVFDRGLKSVIICLLMLFFAHKGNAQVSSPGSVYFLNPFAINPAMSGVEEDLKVTLSYRQQASSIGSGTNTQYVTADYGYSERVGLGIAVFRQEMGILEGTRFMANYSYHLPLSDHENLSFGLSFGAVDETINVDEIIGDPGDQLVADFNDTGIQLDGDFGVSYTMNKLNIQVSALHLGSLVYDNGENMITTIRQPAVFVAAGYKFLLKEGVNAIGLTPRALYRKVREYEEIVDIGAQINFLDEKLSFFTMYHTSKSATFGVGVEIRDLVVFNSMFTTQSTEYDGDAGSTFEFALQLRLD